MGIRLGNKVGLALGVGVVAAGCTVGPDFKRPSLWTPGSYTAGRASSAAQEASLPVAEPVDPEWWAAFGDPVLTGLMRRAAAANLDVRAATARLAQSRAQVRISGASAYPDVNTNGSYTRQRPSERGVLGLFGGGAGSGGTGSAGQGALGSNGLGGRQGASPSGGQGIGAFDLFQAGFDSSWELDIWGRVRRGVESARASADATEEARRATLVSALAEIARDYVQLRGVQRTIQITLDNLASAQQSARLTRERQRAGLTTDLDVANAQGQVASNAAAIPPLEQQQAQLVNAIGLLLGAPPGALGSELRPPRPVPPVPPRVPIGLPSELARRRPDIRRAEAQLHAATADIGVAEADFYPRITLAGSFAFQSLQLRDLADWAARTYSFGPSISLPIFDGFRRKGTLELRKQQQQEAAIAYQKAVLQAFTEVDDALTAYQAEQRRSVQLQDAVTQNRLAVNLAQQRYRQGISDFLEALTAQRSLLAAEQQLASSTAAVSTNLVQLYKALGGGWEASYPEAESAALAAR